MAMAMDIESCALQLWDILLQNLRERRHRCSRVSSIFAVVFESMVRSWAVKSNFSKLNLENLEVAMWLQKPRSASSRDYSQLGTVFVFLHNFPVRPFNSFSTYIMSTRANFSQSRERLRKLPGSLVR